MRLIDSHAHLDDRAFASDRAALIAALHADGIVAITVGSSLRSSQEASRLATKHPAVWATVGAHPHGARHVTEATLGAFAQLAARPEVVAVGEIGLDYYRDLSPRDVQRRVFRRQLELARDVDLPVVLHNRESSDDLLSILRAAGDHHRGVVHSFLGDAALAEAFLELGLHLGVGGPITFPQRGALRAVVAELPLERLLVETDCPYLTPVPHRGKRNEPAYVELVVEEIARVKGLPSDAVAAATTENAVRLFALDELP
ncbi:MAG: TatD family hydrolase [Candidatus Bipolaricaulota bacterium]|nr:MAG: TatD family hydrolase [Candidatus Bipolaricaulota bacterium]